MIENGSILKNTYRLMEEIGSGGGGIVYKAYHERLKKYVVVKEIRDCVKGVLESSTEANILKNLRQTYLPQVFDFIETDEKIFTVIDYIPGESLDKALEKEGKFNQKEVLKWVKQLAEALAYLHSQTPPIIHSDIKPANIMLTPQRDICLIDFNVSLAFDEGMRTSTGISGGYSPPEQYWNYAMYCSMTGKPMEVKHDNASPKESGERRQTALVGKASEEETRQHKTQFVNKEAKSAVLERNRWTERFTKLIGRGVDERSDIYSLGTTIYHLLTGEIPSRNFEEIVSVTEYDISLSEGFGLIISKMMELSPDLRYQNGTELLDALNHIHELDWRYKKYRQKIRNWKGLITALCASGIIITALGVVTIQKEHVAAYNHAVSEAGNWISMGDFDDAETSIQAAMKLYPNRLEAYQKEILRLYTMELYEDCILYARNVLENPMIMPDGEISNSAIGDIFYIMGNAFFEKNDFSNACNSFKSAISYNDANNLYYRDYAVSLAQVGNAEKANEQLDCAIKLGLGQDSIYFVQGEIAFSEGKYSEAEKYFTTCINGTKSESLRKRAVLLCASSYKKMGMDYLDQEINFLEQIISTNGRQQSMNIVESLADAYVRKGEADAQNRLFWYQKAVESFEFLYSNGYSTRQIVENIAILYGQMDQLEQAETLLLQMIEKYPDHYKGYKRLAFLEADIQQKKPNEQRDYQRMKEYYEKMMELYSTQNDSNDVEVQMLQNLMKDLQDGGWFAK